MPNMCDVWPIEMEILDPNTSPLRKIQLLVKLYDLHVVPSIKDKCIRQIQRITEDELNG